MNQIKIGKFIADCRKEKGLTQSMLAEHFGISDRAVSKWENGKCLPDASIMIDLCNLLGISVNELLQGEKITMENYESKAEETIIKLSEKNEITSKRLLNSEIIVAVLLVTLLIGANIIAGLFIKTQLAEAIVNIVGILIIFIYAFYAIRIETETGYYQCNVCGTTFTPAYRQVLMAPHMGWTRKMKCPGCGKKTWNKKVFSK